MRGIPLLIVAVAAFSTAATAQVSKKAEMVRQKAQQSSDALVNGDVETMVRFTHPKVVELMGGREKMAAVVRKGMAEMNAGGTKIVSAKPEPPAEFVRMGTEEVAVVPFTLVMKVPGATLTQKTFLLGISSGQGKSWTFIDGAGLDDESIKKVLPDFPTQVKLPKKVRPTVKRD